MTVYEEKLLDKNNYIVHPITIREQETATEVARRRRDFHRGYGSQRHWDDKEKGEYADEYWGALGEIVFRKHLAHRILDESLDFPPLFTEDQTNTPKYDAKIGAKKIEIKAIPPDSNGKKRIRLMIKESEFHDDDYFVAIKFWDEETYSFCGYLTRSEVLESDIIDLPYSRGYCFFLSELRKMTINFYRS
jgi:hypothetical protein